MEAVTGKTVHYRLSPSGLGTMYLIWTGFFILYWTPFGHLYNEKG